MSENTSKAKPRGKPFTGADDPRRSNTGTRTAADVAFNRSLREIIASVGNEQVKEGSTTYTRVEMMVRGLYEKASKGDVVAFNALAERVEGKVPFVNQLTGANGGPIQTEEIHLTDEQRIERIIALVNLAKARRDAAAEQTVSSASSAINEKAF